MGGHRSGRVGRSLSVPARAASGQRHAGGRGADSRSFSLSAMWKETVLWLFVINLGIAFGAGLYEARVVVPQWAGLPTRQWPNTGLMFWVYVTTVPLTLLTLAAFFAGWWSPAPVRGWLLAAACIVLVERIATFGYFIPTMARLMGADGLPEAEVKATLAQWRAANHGRHLLTLAGWLAALKALSLGRVG